MNIFVLDENPAIAAQMHCDKHVVKMVTESAQLLSTALRVNGLDIGYNITHKNHPCAIWARQSLDNFQWLVDLAYYLNKEWQYRFNHTKNHKAYDMVKSIYRYAYSVSFPQVGLTPFAKCFPEYLRHLDVVPGYRQTYILEKPHLLTYTSRKPPYFIPKSLVTRK